MKKKIIFVIVGVLLIFLIYVNRNGHIKSIRWKSNSISRISDFLYFTKGGYDIDGKTIVVGEEEYGTIIISLHKYLIVTNKEGEFCLYANKGEKTDEE